MERVVYSIQEIGELLGISKSYAYQLVREGTIPSVKLGSKRVIPKEKSNKWLNYEENEKLQQRLLFYASNKQKEVI